MMSLVLAIVIYQGTSLMGKIPENQHVDLLHSVLLSYIVDLKYETGLVCHSMSIWQYVTVLYGYI